MSDIAVPALAWDDSNWLLLAGYHQLPRPSAQERYCPTERSQKWGGEVHQVHAKDGGRPGMGTFFSPTHLGSPEMKYSCTVAVLSWDWNTSRWQNSRHKSSGLKAVLYRDLPWVQAYSLVFIRFHGNCHDGVIFSSPFLSPLGWKQLFDFCPNLQTIPQEHHRQRRCQHQEGETTSLSLVLTVVTAIN